MKKLILFLLIAVLLVSMTGCAAGPNPGKKIADEEGDVAGFIMGVWHGVITPVAFVISLFNKSINIYETHNNGGWYNFGFVLGLTIIFGGGGGGSCAANRRRRRDY